MSSQIRNESPRQSPTSTSSTVLGAPEESSGMAPKRFSKKWWTTTIAVFCLPCRFASGDTIGSQKPVSNAASGTQVVQPPRPVATRSTQGTPVTAGPVAPVPLDFLLNEYFSKVGWRVEVSAEMHTHFANLQVNTVTTPEASVHLTPKLGSELNSEIKRSLVRLYCFDLLSRPPGTSKANVADAHARLSESQPMHRALTRATYNRLAARLAGQSDAAKSVIAASASITMSHAMWRAASARMPNEVFSQDAETFLSQVATICPSIIPQWSSLKSEAQELLPAAYLPQAHFRHMLYTEGGDNMFASLRKHIADGKLSDAQYDVWVGRWLINIAGFRGHEQYRGSIYLDEPTGQAVLTLLEALDALRKNPAHDVLGPYLRYRAGLVGLEDSLYTGHLASMLRLYTEEEAYGLKEWFNKLSAVSRQKCEIEYSEYLREIQVTPTFEPAFLQSLRLHMDNLSEIVDIYRRVVPPAFVQYLEAVKVTKRIAPKTPLCFREMASQEQVKAFSKAFAESGAVPPIYVRDDGMVVAQAPVVP